MGLSFVTLEDLYFDIKHTCLDFCVIVPEFYNSTQDVDFASAVFSQHACAGAEFDLNDSVLLGLGLSYSLTGDLYGAKGYITHPINGLTNETTFSNMNHWALLLSLKYLLGG